MWTRMMSHLRQIMAFLAPALVMLFFALVLNTGEILKRPIGTRDDLPGGLQRLEATVQTEDWEAAATRLDEVAVAMRLVRPRIELASELSELNRFDETVALLRGALRARDLSASLQHIAMLRLIYEGLGE